MFFVHSNRMRKPVAFLLVFLFGEGLSDIALPFGYRAGDQFLRKDYNNCSIQQNLTRSFNVGRETYRTLFVCDDGLLVLGETKPNYTDENWMVGTNALLVTTAWLLSTFRQDYNVDYLCSMNNAADPDDNLYTSLSYYEEDYCSLAYGYGLTFREDDSYFAYNYPDDIMPNAFNNQMFREVVNDDQGDLSLITALINRDIFEASWAFVLTNYKLKTAPTQSWRKFLTSQVTLACDGKNTPDNLSDDICVIVFDFEDLPVVDYEGDFIDVGIHDGIDWDSGDPLLLLPHSGTTKVSKLRYESNWNTPGLWVYELNQNGMGEAVREMASVDKVATTAGKVLGVLILTHLMLQIVFE